MNQAQERQHNQPCEDCTKCGGPRVWKLRKRGTSERYCSACASAKAAKRRKVHPDRVREASRRYEEANQKKRAEAQRRYKKANPDKYHENRRRWREANPEKCRESSRRWARENPEQKRANSARYRARKAQAFDDGWSFEAMTKMMRTGEHTCFICEKATADTVEHLIPISLGGGNTWDNLALACQSCNSAKGGDNRREPLYPEAPGWEAFLAERRA